MVSKGVGAEIETTKQGHGHEVALEADSRPGAGDAGRPVREAPSPGRCPLQSMQRLAEPGFLQLLCYRPSLSTTVKCM